MSAFVAIPAAIASQAGALVIGAGHDSWTLYNARQEVRDRVQQLNVLRSRVEAGNTPPVVADAYKRYLDELLLLEDSRTTLLYMSSLRAVACSVIAVGTARDALRIARGIPVGWGGLTNSFNVSDVVRHLNARATAKAVATAQASGLVRPSAGGPLGASPSPLSQRPAVQLLQSMDAAGLADLRRQAASSLLKRTLRVFAAGSVLWLGGLQVLRYLGHDVSVVYETKPVPDIPALLDQELRQ